MVCAGASEWVCMSSDAPQMGSACRLGRGGGSFAAYLELHDIKCAMYERTCNQVLLSIKELLVVAV